MNSLNWLTNVVTEYREQIFTLSYLLLSLATSFHIVAYKRDTRAAIGWMGLAWLSPFLGALIYFSFGVNRIQRRATRLAVSDAAGPSTHYDPLTVEEEQEWNNHIVAYPMLESIRKLSRQLTQRELTPGNRVQALINGDEAYPAMIAAIESATRSVSLLSYIFDNDRAGQLFLQALAAADQRGVEVRVLVDDVGARYSNPSMIKSLRSAGITCSTFLPTQLPRPPTYSNLRNHRKILVIDGHTGFTGGTNIRASHCLNWPQKDYAQCLHFQLEGPVVASLQRTFTIDWAFATGEILSGDLWYPQIDRRGQVWARGVLDGPDEDFERLADLIMGAISVARSNIRIITPYFLPNQALIQALGVAAMRGVEVDILLPVKNNLRIVQWAMMGQLWQVIAKQCRVHLTPEPFDHTKLLVVDNSWSLIGSTNWDPRSLRLNFEFNVECYDENLALELIEIFEHRRASATPLTLETLRARPAWKQLRDSFVSLASPYL